MTHSPPVIGNGTGFKPPLAGCSTLRGSKRPSSAGLLFSFRRQRTHEIALGEVSDGFAGLGKGSGYLRGGIDP